MAYRTSGGDFNNISRICLAGDAHIMFVGDSTSSEGRNYTVAHNSHVNYTFRNLRWNYMVAGAGLSAGSSPNYSCAPGYSSAAATTSYPTNTRGTADTTGFGPKLIRMTHKLTFTGDAADGVAMCTQTQGVYLNRGNTNANQNVIAGRLATWPNVTQHASGARPWYHDSGSGDGYIKGKLIAACGAASQCTSIDLFVKRWSPSGSVNNTSALVTMTTTNAATYQASGWTAALADAGNYNATVGDMYNDHSVQLGIAGTTGFNETGLIFAPAAAVFARCDSGGTIATNARGASCGYDAMGRSGCYVGDYAITYATQTDWQAYFAATVLNPTGVTVMFIDLGRNVDPGTVSVEQSGGAVTATWSTNYQTFIDKLRGAYAAAFPTGKLHLCLIVPPICTVESNFMSTTTACNSVQSAVEALVAANVNMSWFSHYNYYSNTPPIVTLHTASMADSDKLAYALRDTMDRATFFEFTEQGMFGTPYAGGRRSLGY